MSKPQMPADVERLTAPKHIKAADAPRFLWGDAEAGYVTDWIYGSSPKVHMMSFALAVGQKFTHSPDFRTYYDCDETYYCLAGEFTFHCPETGEVQVLKKGDFLHFPPRTWHHGYNFGTETCRIVEAITPAVREHIEDFSAQHSLDDWRRVTEGTIGGLVAGRTPQAPRSTLIREQDWVYELVGAERPLRVGLACSTERLTTGVIDLHPGQVSEPITHPGDKVVFHLEGMLNMRIWPTEQWWELHPGDTAFVPEGVAHSFHNLTDERVRLTFSVAPRYR